jgi:protein-L-isoaspartate O-methyltransferase
MARARSLVVAADGDLVVERDPGRPSGRLLRQNDMDASYVDLADARHLEFNYLRWIRIVLRAFDAHRVVHVGGAACTLARALLAEDRTGRHEVVEVDQRVFDIARAHLGLRRQPALKLRVGDGRAAVAAHADGSADAIVVDAFVGARVPRHLVTSEAISGFVRVAPLTVVNVVDTAGLPDTRAIAAALAEAYPHVAAFSGARRGGNVVLFGSSSMPRYAHLESAVAADAAPAQLLQASDLAGSAPWRDGSERETQDRLSMIRTSSSRL